MSMRIDKIDIMKGVLILLVVIGHAIQYNIPNFEKNIFFNIIYSFHMPLFMFISGNTCFYTIKCENLRDSINLLIKKFKSLIIPFYSWYFIVGYLLKGIYIKINFIDYAKALIMSPDNGLWFLEVLFLNYIFIQVLIFLNTKFNSNNNMLIELLLIAITNMLIRLIPINILGIGLLKWHSIFFMLGYFSMKYKEKIYKNFYFLKELSFVLFPLLLIKYNFFEMPSLILDLNFKLTFINGFINLVYRYLIAFCGIIVSIYVFSDIKSMIMRKILIFLGKNTLCIYSIHYYFISIIDASELKYNFLGINMIIVIFSTIISICCSVMIYKYFINKSYILSAILFGKIKKNIKY